MFEAGADRLEILTLNQSTVHMNSMHTKNCKGGCVCHRMHSHAPFIFVQAGSFSMQLNQWQEVAVDEDLGSKLYVMISRTPRVYQQNMQVQQIKGVKS